MGSATSKPIRPAATSAVRTPVVVASTSITAGAIAPPSIPAKVCIEKARPIRDEATLADRIA